MNMILLGGKARFGKTTVANMFADLVTQSGKKPIVLSYAGYVKYVAKTYYGWNGEKDEIGRSLLQDIGDGFRNKYSQTYWIDRLMSDIELIKDHYDYIIVDDCRYPNEILIPKKSFKSYGIRINRINFESDLTEEQKNNASETALDNFNFDYTISSISGVENLINPVKELYLNIKAGE